MDKTYDNEEQLEQLLELIKDDNLKSQVYYKTARAFEASETTDFQNVILKTFLDFTELRVSLT